MENITEVLNKELNQVTVTKVSIVSSCLNCPYREYENTMEGSWYICKHKESPEGYGDIIHGCNAGFEKTPDWCPMGLI